MKYKKMQSGGEQELLQLLSEYAQSKGINPQELITDFQQASPEQQEEFLSQIQGKTEMQYGGIPVSKNGLYEHPNSSVIVPTNNTGRITMKGINYSVDAYDADSGEFLQTMQPNQNYQFDVNNVLEIPKGKFGISKMQSGGNRGTKGVSYFSNNFNNDEVRDLMLERRLEREQIAKGEKQALEELKKLKKSKNIKGKIEKNFGKNETKAFFDELEDFTEEQIEDVIKKGDDSKHSGKFKKMLRGKGNILLNLFETSPWMQAFIQESSISPTQVKPKEKQIDKTTAFKLREQGYNVPDSMIEGNEKSSTTIPLKSNKQNNFVTNYFKQPESKYQLPSKFNISKTTPVQPQNPSTIRNENKNRDEFGFVKDLSKVRDKSRKDNINDYKSWVNEWDSVIPNFKSLSYPEQQKQALDWIKKNQGKLDYNGVLGQLNNWGYKDSPDKLLTDGMFAEGTNLMRPSNLIGKTDISPISPLTPKGITSTTPKLPSSEELQKKVVVPKENDEELDMKDVVLGKLNNKDYASQYLSGAKIRNNRVMAPYFRRTDLALPELYQEDVSPYLANINRTANGALQNINTNSTVGQAAATQIASNAAFQSNLIQGQVANRNLERKTNWANTIASIKSQQSQIDDANRAQYSDDWMRTLAAKDNIDNLIDYQAANFKMVNQRDRNKDVMNAAISSMINPNFDLQIDENGNITYGVKKTNQFKNPVPAKFGIKKKAL